MIGLYRTVVMTSAPERGAVLADMPHAPGLSAELSPSPPMADLPEMPLPEQRLFRVNMNLVPLLGTLRWHELQILGGPPWHQVVVGLRLPDAMWLNVKVAVEPLRPWHSPTFLIAFVLMTVVAAILTLWAVRRADRSGGDAGGGR